MQGTMEIDLKEILWAMLYKAWMIILSAAVVAVAVYGYTALFVTPLYKAQVSIYVNNTTQTQNQVGVTYTDLTAAQRLVKTYVNFLSSDTVLEKVADQVGRGMTAGKIRGMMEAADMNGTEAFVVAITNADPELAADIANAIADVAPEVIATYIPGSSTNVIDKAKVPTSPASPAKAKNAIIGGLIGGVIAVVIVALQVVLDVRIKDEQDLQLLVPEVSVLGVIPNFDADPKSGYEYESKSNHEAGSREVRK